MVRVWVVLAVVAALNGAAVFAGEGSGAGVFTPFDTAHLMGSPEKHESFGVERTFEKLKFKRPVEFTFAPDGSGRVFVVEQDGRIHVFPNDPNVEKTTVFLDISKAVRRDHNEEGLLGLAFHPQFKENGYFNVFYSVTPMGSVLLRVKPGDPADSMLITRMSVRDGKRQMPPLATHVVDAEAVQVLKKWITDIPIQMPATK